MGASDVIGIDIGGTFTDVVRLNGESGELAVDKIPTTSGHLLDGIRSALDSLKEANGRDFASVGTVVHGTTVATNAMIEESLPETALLVSAGFGDILDIGTMLRPDMYDLTKPKIPSLVSRRMVVEVNERIDASGAVIDPLDDVEIERVVSIVSELGPRAVAICLLFSFVDSRHEERLASALASSLPDVFIAESSHVDPQIREYPRANTTVLNASLRPVVENYINEFVDLVASYQGEQDLFVMQSSGGLIAPADVTRNAHRLLLSGPAGGVIAAKRLLSPKYPNLITFDMGGTSSDLSLIAEGESTVQKAPSPHERRPIRASALAINGVGAGGGSIAEVVEGVLRVGPRSAGASPGPVAYGRGGVQPTVTDAQIVLGRIDAGGLLGGEIDLDADLAREAIRTRIAEPQGLSVSEAAIAIVEVAVAAMARGLRLISVNAGFDPADFALVAFGGGGPLHACDLAKASGIRRVLVPHASSVYSAVGLICADPQQERTAVIEERATAIDGDDLRTRFQALEASAVDGLGSRGGVSHDVKCVWILECRYLGQRQSIRVEVPRRLGEAVDMLGVMERFGLRHKREFGHSNDADPIEITTARVIASSDRESEIQAFRRSIGPSALSTSSKSRSVFFPGFDYVETPVISKVQLGEGETVPGPLVIQERESTTIVPPGWEVSRDGDSTTRIEVTS